jgi:predicted nucleic acid-binding protein
MFFVMDATIAAAWALPEENSELTDSLLTMCQIDGAMVPILFWYEIRHILAQAERLQRITPADTVAFLHQLERLEIRLRDLGDGEAILRLARVHQLSVYNAAYLELALRENLPLVSLDRALAMAAVKESVPRLDL